MFVYKTWKRSFLSISRFDTWLVVDQILDNSIRVFNPNPTSPGRVDTRVYLNPTFSDFRANFCANFKVYNQAFNWIMYLPGRKLDFFLPKLFHTYPSFCYPLHHYTWLKHWPNNFKIDRLKSYGAQLFLGFDHSRPLPRSFSTGFRHFLNNFGHWNSRT